MDKARIGNGKTALITGASSGIGEALAACFAKDGFDLMLVARSVDKLEALAAKLATKYKVKVMVEPADLAVAGSAKKLATTMKRRKRIIDVVANNAGVLEHGAFAAMTPERNQQLIDLNISGLTAMLSYFVPPMVARGHGRILNVASVAAFQPIPSLATYAATKAYVLSLTESLSEEFKDTGVTITALCPGVTATNMLSKAASSSSKLTKLPKLLIGDVDKVAQEGYEACIKGEVIKVPGTINQAAMVAGRATPKWLLRKFTGRLGRKSL